jgi:tetratricopeptide (TPR) repeat protein
MKTTGKIDKKLVIILIMIIPGLSCSFFLKAQTGFEYYNMALVKYNLHDYPGAYDDLTKVIEVEPRHAPAYNLRGMVNFNLENIADAIEDYSKAIDIFSSEPEGLRLSVYDRHGNPVEPPAKADPDLAVPYYNRAIAKTALSEMEGAIEDYDKAIENDPKMVTAWYNRAYAKYTLGDHEGACADWIQAEKLGLPEAGQMRQENCMTESEP